MKAEIAKYFWGLNKKALKQAVEILRDPAHPRFVERLVTLLSRCDNPREVFSLLPKKKFVLVWPKVSRYWKKIAPQSDFRDWWQTIYEQLSKRQKGKKQLEENLPVIFSKIGAVIRQARVKQGFSQGELALKVGMRQPDISAIEDGKKNITLRTLAALCRVLEIDRIEIR